MCTRASWRYSTCYRGWEVRCSVRTSSRGSGRWGEAGLGAVGRGRLSPGPIQRRPLPDPLLLPRPQLCRCHHISLLQLLCAPHLRGLPARLLWVSFPTGMGRAWRRQGAWEVVGGGSWCPAHHPAAGGLRAMGAPAWLPAVLCLQLPAHAHPLLQGPPAPYSHPVQALGRMRQMVCICLYPRVHTHIYAYAHTCIYTFYMQHTQAYTLSAQESVYAQCSTLACFSF